MEKVSHSKESEVHLNNKGTRKPNGSGYIRERRNGLWEGQYTSGYDLKTGKQIQRSVYGKTQAEVRRKLAEIEVKIDKGTFVTPQKITLGEWLDIWMTEYTGNIKSSTRGSYEQRVRVHIKPYLGRFKLTALTTQIIQTFYNELQTKENLSPKTVRNTHVALHRALEIARKLGYINANPADLVILPRMEPKKIRTLDKDELIDFLTEIKGHKYEAIMFTTVFTGLRLGEVLGLTWDCVDFDNNLITVEKQHGRDRVTGEYVFSSIKNDQTRVLTVAQEVMNVLKDHKRQQRQMAKDAGKEWSNPKNLVFTTETGRYIENKMLYMYFKRVVKKIGMSDMRFHDLRHTYAVNSLKAGDDIKTLQENLGHATASFTLSTYAHATPNMKQECARRMDNFIHSVISEE